MDNACPFSRCISFQRQTVPWTPGGWHTGRVRGLDHFKLVEHAAKCASPHFEHCFSIRFHAAFGLPAALSNFPPESNTESARACSSYLWCLASSFSYKPQL